MREQVGSKAERALTCERRVDGIGAVAASRTPGPDPEVVAPRLRVEDRKNRSLKRPCHGRATTSGSRRRRRTQAVAVRGRTSSAACGRRPGSSTGSLGARTTAQAHDRRAQSRRATGRPARSRRDARSISSDQAEDDDGDGEHPDRPSAHELPEPEEDVRARRRVSRSSRASRTISARTSSATSRDEHSERLRMEHRTGLQDCRKEREERHGADPDHGTRGPQRSGQQKHDTPGRDHRSALTS